MIKNYKIARLIPGLIFILSFLISPAYAQINTGDIHGNFELNAQYYIKDSVIGTKEVPEKLLSNGYANFVYEKNNFSAGLRYESYLNPLLGFEGYKGSGIPFRYLTYKNNELEVTAGNFYEQFGSGLIFRAYEDKGLGYDNAMDGFRVKYKPFRGIYFKGVIGTQRDFWDKGEGIVRGGDLEVDLSETFTSMATNKTKWILGGSFVSKYQEDENPTFVLPKNVGSSSGRITMINGGLTMRGEFAYKINDPSSDNGYIYKNGNAILFNAAYSKKGFGASFGMKRIDNMSYRSEREAKLNSLIINYLPAMTKQHTYILPAIYPYATQPNGEFGIQGEVFFYLKPESSLGGRYGTDVSINYSKATEIEKTPTGDDLGYTSEFFKMGKKRYFEDINFEVNRKLSKKVRLILSYIYIDFNKDVIQSQGSGAGHVCSHTGVVEVNYKINSKKAIRTELQHLYTKQDQQSWGLLLVEYTVSPHWFIAGYDEYNYGNDIPDNRLHYFQLGFGYTNNTNRVSLSYGRQRAGILCVGGVCRNVPAANGVTLSITSSF